MVPDAWCRSEMRGSFRVEQTATSAAPGAAAFSMNSSFWLMVRWSSQGTHGNCESAGGLCDVEAEVVEDLPAHRRLGETMSFSRAFGPRPLWVACVARAR
jgi:hypothetical protein